MKVLPERGKRSKPIKPRYRRNSTATRARIVAAARVAFAQNGYDEVGMREIAAVADVDTALLVQYYGSKEGLFRDVAQGAFAFDLLLGDLLLGCLPPEEPDAPQRNRAAQLMDDMDSAVWSRRFDPFRLLLNSLGSTTAAPIVSAHLLKDFVYPIEQLLSGDDNRERAVMFTSQVVGFAVMRIALFCAEAEFPNREKLQALLAAALDANLGSLSAL